MNLPAIGDVFYLKNDGSCIIFKTNIMVELSNIEFIGMFCMGAFVGGILNYGLREIEDETSFSKIVTTIFGAAFSGVVFVFLEFLINAKAPKPGEGSEHIYMYPLGLIIALMWAQVPVTIEKYINSDKKLLKAIGIAHMMFMVLVTIYLIIFLFI